jgi:2-methylisocitrate lyase-like PEP mutase family enzyme
MANMVEGGMTPMVNAKGLQEMGFSLVIFPGGVVRAMAHAAAAFYATLMNDGGSDAFRNQMFDFQGLNAAIGTPEMLALGKRYEGDA